MKGIFDILFLSLLTFVLLPLTERRVTYCIVLIKH